MDLVPIRRALLSVSDKTGLIDFARGLAELGVELISTGGTAKTLSSAGLTVRDVADLTGFPEMLDGRVKTLHPKVHGGILARRDNADHMRMIADHQILPIDMVVVNLYPFEKTVAKPEVHYDEAIENIDIGGPSMVRSAAKNHADVAVVTDANQYASVLRELTAQSGALSLATRKMMAGAAFTRTAAYDQAISDYFARQSSQGNDLPASFRLLLPHKRGLRYGENPHQAAAFYTEANPPAASVAGAEVLHGKELSFNNILDLESALNLVRELPGPAAVVIKHNNPCGAGVAGTLAEAFRKAYEGDPQSAFGGVIGFNREVDSSTADQLTEPNRFVECIIAPGYSESALQILTTRPTWKKSVRLLKTGPLMIPREGWDLRRIDGGLLVQALDIGSDDWSAAKVATRRQPTDHEWDDLRFAWTVCKHVKSNAIVLAAGGRVVGVGAGQMSRVDSVEIAAKKAGERTGGAVLASDAFFPFRDNVDAAARAGIKAIVQPGGSVRDADSIAACDEHGLAMVFTGIRHFRH